MKNKRRVLRLKGGLYVKKTMILHLSELLVHAIYIDCIVSDAHANYTPVLQTTTDIASQRIIGACYLHLVITC